MKKIHIFVLLITIAAQAIATQPIQISGGGSHTIFLMPNRTIQASGANYYGQLGLGDNQNRLIPTPVAYLNNIIKAAAGTNHTLLLFANGQVKSAGSNLYGQLGNSSELRNQSIFMPVALDTDNAIDISSGGYHSLVVTGSEKRLFAFGSNRNGQLCVKTNNSKELMPLDTGITGVTAVVAGDHHTLFLKDGIMYGCGSNKYGQLGNSSYPDGSFGAIPVTNLSKVISISAGGEHSVALTSDFLYTFGRGDFGQLCTGDLNNRNTPTRIDLHNIKSIDSKGPFTAILINDGSVWTCGPRRFGSIPTLWSDLPFIGKIATGHWHIFALSTNGTSWFWGRNKSGQGGDGTLKNKMSPIEITYFFVDTKNK